MGFGFFSIRTRSICRSLSSMMVRRSSWLRILISVGLAQLWNAQHFRLHVAQGLDQVFCIWSMCSFNSRFNSRKSCLVANSCSGIVVAKARLNSRKEPHAAKNKRRTATPAASRSRAPRGTDIWSSSPLRCRQPHLQRRPPLRPIARRDRASMLRHDPLGHGQSQSGPSGIQPGSNKCHENVG